MAGLICYYNTRHYYYFNVSTNQKRGRCLNLVKCDNSDYEEILERPISIIKEGDIELKVVWNYGILNFYFRDLFPGIRIYFQT